VSAPSLNFAFLHKHEPVLAELGALAEQYFHDDPNTSLLKCRQLCEEMGKRAVARHGLYAPEVRDQVEVINLLRDRGVIDEQLARIFHTVRRTGNDAMHQLRSDYALQTLRFSHTIAEWYLRAFFNAGFKAGPFIPPRPPKNASTDLLMEIAELRRQLAESQKLSEKVTVAEQARMTAEQRAEQAEEDRRITEQLALEVESKYRDSTSEEIKLRDELLRDAEKRLKETQVQLTLLQTQAAQATPAQQNTLQKAAVAATERIKLSEADTRKLIDGQLRDVGWEADTSTLNYKRGTRPVKGRNLAIAEWPTKNGPADYVLFCGLEAVGVVEAKRAAKDVSASLEQSKRYSEGFEFKNDAQPVGQFEKYKVPFLFATNGHGFVEQLRTKSGIWFRDARVSTNESRPLVGWYSPDDLKGYLKQKIADANAALAEEPTEYLELRDYQIRAIQAVEQAVVRGDRRILVAMATGTGKTRTAIGLVYRLLKTKRFRRILFLVDRTSLGEQTSEAFEKTRIEGLQTFAQIFDIKGLDAIKPDPETKLHIATVQGMVKRIMYPNDPSETPNVGAYDCVVIDECHRGYGLDRELSDSELRFRDLRDYISKYRRVIDHFDAVKIGLTATPALHTKEIFGAPIARYTYREAVIDGYLIDHEPPISLTTLLAQNGIRWAKGEQAQLFDPKTRSIDLVDLEDEVAVEIDAFNKTVITENFNRVVCDYLALHLDPTDAAKTLIFCATDEHADIVVRLLLDAFRKRYGEVDDDAVKKITGQADKPLSLIRHYKNESMPNVAVTVDLLTTGIDVPKISNVVFLRRVRSRILYEQMLGRATRLCPEIGKETFRIFDAVALYEALEAYSDMKPVVPGPSFTFEKLSDEVGTLTDEEEQQTAIDQLVAKLQRKKQRLKGEDLADFEKVARTTPADLAAELRPLKGKDAADWVKKNAFILQLLDRRKETERALLVSDHHDELVRVERGYGKAKKPDDYLEGFAKYLKENMNQIPALAVVTQRPRELTRAQLRDLALALDSAGFNESALRTAWREKTNADIAATIVGFIRQAALGDPLVPYEERVDRALKKLLSREPWSTPQRKWLERIGEQLKKERVVDKSALDDEPFKGQGGFSRLNKAFDGKLDSILTDLQASIWENTG
jgi:type I restriction enzyme R subunit